MAHLFARQGVVAKLRRSPGQAENARGGGVGFEPPPGRKESEKDS